ncbi:MAG TPA: glycosyltransferase family 4 protein, partial [Candidatus Paceibacterota bacterium]|nr:glycosyltransferase family 4 protein [Candidatus Paceibacterota bacterium]
SFGAGRAAKRVSKKPFIAHVHSTEFDRVGGDTVDQNIYDLERAGMHEADRVVTVSGRTKDIVVGRYGVPKNKVQAVWNGIDGTTAPAPDPSVPARLSALKKAGYKIVLFMGRITIQKGPDYFVRAARRVIDRDPNVLFILAGSGNMERQMMHLAASLGIADKMLFPGFLRGAEQHEAYALADLFVMPSVSEPFGLAALEAMRIGTPVIVSKQSGVAEAVSNALQVDFWDVEKMADLILSVLESPALRDALSKKGIAEAAGLTWDRSADEVRTLIDQLVPA